MRSLMLPLRNLLQSCWRFQRANNPGPPEWDQEVSSSSVALIAVFLFEESSIQKRESLQLTILRRFQLPNLLHQQASVHHQRYSPSGYCLINLCHFSWIKPNSAGHYLHLNQGDMRFRDKCTENVMTKPHWNWRYTHTHIVIILWLYAAYFQYTLHNPCNNPRW